MPQSFGWKQHQNGQKDVTKCAGIESHCRTTICSTYVFWNDPTGRVLWPFYGRLGLDPLKVRILGGQLPKNRTHPKISRCFFGCKIQCRLCFCLKIWSSLIASPSYGRWSWGVKMAKKARSYSTTTQWDTCGVLENQSNLSRGCLMLWSVYTYKFDGL